MEQNTGVAGNRWDKMENRKHWMKYFDAETVTRLTRIGFAPSGLVEGNLVGNHRSPFHGFAIEFAGHRGYVPGDDTRHIDWKVYYRTGRYLMKQYEQETNLLCHIMLDVSESMEFEWKHGKKRDYAAMMATALAQVITEQTDSVSIHFFDQQMIHEIPMTNGRDIISKIADFYETPGRVFKGTSHIGGALSLLNESSRQRHAVFVISDFFNDLDQVFDGVKRLLGNKHEVILLQVVDPLEVSFDLPGKVRLLELEGTRRLDVNALNIRDSYEELFHAFLHEMEERSRKLGVDYILCNTGRPFGIHLAEYLSSKQLRSGGGGHGS